MKRFFMVFTAIAVCALLFSACDMGLGIEETDIRYEEYADSLFLVSTIDKNPAGLIIKSVEEKEEFIELTRKGYFDYYGYLDFDVLQENWELRESWLVSFFNEYDDKFFTDTNLVMILMFGGSVPARLKVKKISVKNNELYIDVDGGSAQLIGISWVSLDVVTTTGCNILIPIKKNEFNGSKVNIRIRITRLW